MRDKRDKAITLFYKKSCLKGSENWRKVFSNKIIVALVTLALLTYLLFRPVA